MKEKMCAKKGVLMRAKAPNNFDDLENAESKIVFSNESKRNHPTFENLKVIYIEPFFFVPVPQVLPGSPRFSQEIPGNPKTHPSVMLIPRVASFCNAYF